MKGFQKYKENKISLLWKMTNFCTIHRKNYEDLYAMCLYKGRKMPDKLQCRMGATKVSSTIGVSLKCWITSDEDDNVLMCYMCPVKIQVLELYGKKCLIKVLQVWHEISCEIPRNGRDILKKVIEIRTLEGFAHDLKKM